MLWTALKGFRTAGIRVPVWRSLALGLVGVAVLFMLWWALRSKDWLEVHRDNEGHMAGFVVDPQRIPKEVLDSLPNPQDVRKLDKTQLKQLAEATGLFQSRKVNPHLVFDAGVIDYWAKQKRSAWEFALEFLSRRLILEAAERQGAVIPFVGDLSMWSERLYPYLKKRALENRQVRGVSHGCFAATSPAGVHAC
jgi:hypothetical protein